VSGGSPVAVPGLGRLGVVLGLFLFVVGNGGVGGVGRVGGGWGCWVCWVGGYFFFNPKILTTLTPTSIPP